MLKKILFITGTRADFGKLKSLIQITSEDSTFEVHIFATGMHLLEQYGYTVNEIEKSGFTNIHRFSNGNIGNGMDVALARTIEGLSTYVANNRPDLLVVHGDRGEALAGSIVGALNNILVAHIEGGEVSGTVDELIRHAVTKMSHLHFVSNEEARKRLIQLGEIPDNIHVIGSPDMDVMVSNNLPSLAEVKTHYEIPFEHYAILMFHPVTTELHLMEQAASDLFGAAEQSDINFIGIYPNNDAGSDMIMKVLSEYQTHPRFRIFPSLRFEYFLTLLKNARFMLGNSSAGIREAPFYGVPTVNVGTRQSGRSIDNPNIIHCEYDGSEILNAINKAAAMSKLNCQADFGSGNSDQRFLQLLMGEALWKTPAQKRFNDIHWINA